MKSKSLVRLGALAILWGSGFLFIKEALGGLSPFQIVFGQVDIALHGAAVDAAALASKSEGIQVLIVPQYQGFGLTLAGL